MQGIYKRPDSPFWWAIWNDNTGTAHRVSTRVRFADDPEGTEAQRVRDRLMEESDIPVERSWLSLVELYLAGPMKAKAHSTQVQNKQLLLNHLFPTCRRLSLDAIDGAVVRGHIERRRKEGAGEGSIRCEISLMGAMTNWAIRELEWDIRNPWTGRKPKAPEPRTRWLTEDEAERLMAAADEVATEGQWPWIGDYVRLCLHTGMRRAEALGLTWNRVDMDNGVILFAAGDQKSRKAGSIPVNRQARVALMSRLAVGDPMRVFPKGAFPRNAFAKAVERAGLVDVHIHDLRRTFASRLVQSGVGLQTVSKLMRHSNVAITDSVYAHLSHSTLAEAVAVLDGEGTPKLRSVR